ncbi:hypothetical protein CRUP_008404 [Coryphaenoides rupestris]|nr:hypothetical protein CRUP_008404 [Coryphaenoides rupestris]
MDPNSICRKTKRLAGKQAELCQTQPEIVSEVAKGARLGVRECQYQFRYRRWNCTSHNKYFGKVLQQGGDISSSRKPLPPGTLAAQLSVPAVRTGFFQADNCNARSKDVHEAILIRQDKPSDLILDKLGDIRVARMEASMQANMARTRQG